jgi:hypothetical protein
MLNQRTAVALLGASVALSTTAIFAPPAPAAVLAVAALLVAVPVAAQRSGATQFAVWASEVVTRRVRRLRQRLRIARWRRKDEIANLGYGWRDVLNVGDGVIGKMVSPDWPDRPDRQFAVLAAAVERDGHATRQLVQESLNQATAWFKYLERQNDRLSDRNRELRDKIDQMHRDALEAEARARRSSIVSFWAGVAISIPVGVLINLTTR